MQITPINQNKLCKTNNNAPRKQVSFKGEENKSSNDDKYVKVTKREYYFDKFTLAVVAIGAIVGLVKTIFNSKEISEFKPKFKK